jgi:hypothetical protein
MQSDPGSQKNFPAQVIKWRASIDLSTALRGYHSQYRGIFIPSLLLLIYEDGFSKLDAHYLPQQIEGCIIEKEIVVDASLVEPSKKLADAHRHREAMQDELNKTQATYHQYVPLPEYVEGHSSLR